MARYQNILHKYRSYSYHHILFACDSTATAEEVAKLRNFETFRTFRGRDSDQPLVPPNIAGGRYVVLINGMTDVDFFIESANWFTILMPRSGTGIPPFAMASEGEIKIVEPQGARFFNVLDKTFDALQSDSPGLTFMLKTIFIGHTDTGTNEPIADVKPFMLHPYDITSVFDHAGGTYTLRFMAAYNGATKVPALNKNQQISVRGLTNSSALTNLQDKLNERSKETKDRLAKALIEGRLIEYKITLDKVYRDPNNDQQNSPFVLDNIVPQQKEGDGTAVFSFGPGETVDQMIDKIMKASKEAVKLANPIQAPGQAGPSKTKNTEEKKRKIWKVLSTIDSTPDVYGALYHVKQFELEEQTNNDVFVGTEKDHSVEFDYIFSGRNIDILEFDMKMEMGLGFLHELTNSSNSLVDQQGSGVVESNPATKSINSDQASIATAPKYARVGNARIKTPAAPRTNIRGTTMRDHVDSQSTNQFQALLSRWAGYESMEAKLKIHGNPTFLGELSRFPSEIRNQNFSNTF